MSSPEAPNSLPSPDFDRVVTFYNPHPGFAGAAIPLPAVIRKAAKRISGKKITLAEGLDMLQQSAKGFGTAARVSIVEKYQMIFLELVDGQFTHGFCLIQYR